MFGSVSFTQLPAALLTAFLDVLTNLSCVFVQAAATENNVGQRSG